MEPFASLYIIRGEPYRLGTCLNLTAEETVVGRTSSEEPPDISFSNSWISRKHMMIIRNKEGATLYDLGSRHGTEVNGTKIAPNAAVPLQSSDIIKLAKGMVVFHFSYIFDDQTLEFEPIMNTQRLTALTAPHSVNWEKRECIVDGKQLSMSEKEFYLLQLLHGQANTLVTLEQIKRTVWPERQSSLSGATDVSMEEINALIYRIRRKYGRETFLISAVRGNGYILEKEG